MKASEVIVDCTVEGMIHAPEWPLIEEAGARLLVVTNEHPEILERTEPGADLGPKVQARGRDVAERFRDAGYIEGGDGPDD